MGNTTTDDPVTAAGTDINGNEVTLEITVDAIPVKTDIYLNVGQTVTLKHSFVKGSDNIEWKYDDDCISIANADKAKVKITGVSTGAASAGEAKLTCRYRDVIYTTYVHVEKPDVTVKGDLIRRNPNNYSYSLILEKGLTNYTFTPEESGVYRFANTGGYFASLMTLYDTGVIGGSSAARLLAGETASFRSGARTVCRRRSP